MVTDVADQLAILLIHVLLSCQAGENAGLPPGNLSTCLQKLSDTGTKERLRSTTAEALEHGVRNSNSVYVPHLIHKLNL